MAETDDNQAGVAALVEELSGADSGDKDTNKSHIPTIPFAKMRFCNSHKPVGEI